MPAPDPLRKQNYSSFQPPPRVPMRLWSITTWLIVINIAVFLIDMFSSGRLTLWGGFIAGKAVFQFQIWRWVTFQFLHGNADHILFNMIALYFFGPLIERVLGRRLFIIFYLLCGFGGAVGYLILCRFSILGLYPNAVLIGASAGIFGVMVACAVVDPNGMVYLAFTPISFRMKWLVLIFFGMAFVSLWTEGANAGGDAAHLGGAVVGFVLIFAFRRLGRLQGARKKSRFWRPGDPDSHFLNKDFR